MNDEELANLWAALEAKGHPEVVPKLQRVVAAAVGIQTTPTADDALAVGASKLGGKPDLGQTASWPGWKGKPLSFVGQLNLAEVASFPCCAELPSCGLISCFYDSEQQVWGFDPADKGGFVVLYEPEPRALVRTDFPEALDVRFESCRLSFSAKSTLPDWESPHFDELNLSDDQRDAWFEVLEELDDEDGSLGGHQVLGHPAQVQGDMATECQLVTNGLYCGDESGYKDSRAESLQPGWRDWRLLLQIDTDDNAGMMWGDVGRLYFWMRQRDLQAARFEEAWCILQCH